MDEIIRDLLEAARDMLYALECEAEVIEVNPDEPCEAEETCGLAFCETRDASCFALA